MELVRELVETDFFIDTAWEELNRIKEAVAAAVAARASCPAVLTARIAKTWRPWAWSCLAPSIVRFFTLALWGGTLCRLHCKTRVPGHSSSQHDQHAKSRFASKWAATDPTLCEKTHQARLPEASNCQHFLFNLVPHIIYVTYLRLWDLFSIKSWPSTADGCSLAGT